MLRSFLLRSVAGVVLVFTAANLSGCSAVDAQVNHGELQVTTHLSETVFLDPVPQIKRTIYITARNTSDHPEIEIKNALTIAVANRGYLVVQDPTKAQFLLRVNILQAGEVDAKSKNGMLAATYGEPLLGGAVAAGLTSAMGGNSGTTLGVGLGVAAATVAADMMFKQRTYSVAVDIELSSRPLSGQKVQQFTTSQAAQANATSKYQSTGNPTGAGMQGGMNSSTATVNGRAVTQAINEESDFKKYQVRAIAYCDQVNLKFENAVVPLETHLTSALSNLFEEGQAPTQAQIDQAEMAEKAAHHPVVKKDTPPPQQNKKASAHAAAPAGGAANLDDSIPPPPPPHN